MASSYPSLNALKEHTAAMHSRLDVHPRVQDLLGGSPTIEAYSVFLARWYGFLVPIEKTVFPLLVNLPALALDQRRRSRWAQEDLQALGLSLDQIAELPHSPPPVDKPGIAEALGILYVTEGSTLGGAVVLRHLRGALGLTPERGGRFLYAYGDERAERWAQFKAAAEDVLREDTRYLPRAVGAARATFLRFERWLDYEATTSASPQWNSAVNRDP